MSWQFRAVMFAALTAIFAKVGVAVAGKLLGISLTAVGAVLIASGL